MHEVAFTPKMMSADAPLRRLNRAALLILTLAFVMTISSVLRHSLSSDLADEIVSYSSLGAALAGVLALLLVAHDSHVALDSDGIACDGSAARTPLLDDDIGQGDTTINTPDGVMPPPAEEAPTGPADAASEDSPTHAPPASLSNGTVWHNLSSLNYWLLFVAFFAGTGGGLVLTNHISFIVIAQFGPGEGTVQAKPVVDALISLFSVFNACGRLAAGFGSDRFRRHVSRPTLFACAVGLMGLSHLLLLLAHLTPLLYVAVVIAGVAYGALWALLPTIVGELFGLRAFASTYCGYALATSASTLVLSTFLASRVAEANSTPSPSSPSPPSPPLLPGASPPAGGETCYGDACYRLTHLIVAGLCLIGAISVGLVSLRTRSFYARQR